MNTKNEIIWNGKYLGRISIDKFPCRLIMENGVIFEEILFDKYLGWSRYSLSSFFNDIYRGNIQSHCLTPKEIITTMTDDQLNKVGVEKMEIPKIKGSFIWKVFYKRKGKPKG